MKTNTPRVTIIIALYVIEARFFEDFRKFSLQSNKNFEIIVVSDRNVTLPKIKGISIRLILTHKKTTGPSFKRDIGLEKAKGKICAFIDDDAYPDKDWIRNAIKAFNRNDVIAVGGPGITPPEDGYWESVSGLVYESIFCSGKAQHRFIPALPKFIQDWPAYNLFVKTDALKRVGGYGTDFYGGEDTFLCLKLINIGKIYYDPSVVVFHHRRRLLVPLMRQIYNVGVHRGYFAKKFPETSRQAFYFLPSILLTGFVILLVGSFFRTDIRLVFVILLVFFWMLGTFSVLRKTSVATSLVVGLGIMATHLTYGTGFIAGLFIKKLTR